MSGPDLFEVNGGRGAVLSADGRYRYRLWRLWDDCAPIMVWVLLNPSTADADFDDPTLRKCIGFAKRGHYGGVILVNLFAWRATHPADLAIAVDPVGPENDDHIIWACRAPMMASVVAGWGADRRAAMRAARVRHVIQSAGRRDVKCFGTTKNGHPRHPLYLSYSSELRAHGPR